MNPTPASHRPAPHSPRSGRANVYCIVSADGLQYLTVEDGFKPLLDGESTLPLDAWLGGHRKGLMIKAELRGLGDEFDGVRLAAVDMGEE